MNFKIKSTGQKANRGVNSIKGLMMLLGLLFTLNGCVSTNLSDKSSQPLNQAPAWADQSSVGKQMTDDSQIEYANPDRDRFRSSLQLANKQSDQSHDLVFDHVDRSLSRLTDYSVAKSRAGVSKKKTGSKKKIGKVSYLERNGFKGKKIRKNERENVNIVVNHLDSKSDEKIKVTQPSVPLSRIEDRYNRYGELSRGKKIRQFGYDLIRHASYPEKGDQKMFSLSRIKKGAPLFSQDEATRLFAGSSDEKRSFETGEYSSLRPVSSEYIIAPGDEVFVKITGPVDISEVFLVDRNGQLFIPKIGAIRLAGKTASQLSRAVSDKTRTVFKNAYVEVSLGRLRSIQVTVTGNVMTPGLIQVSANSSLLNALAAAGGPSKGGTLRRIQLRRRHAEPRTIDLYAMLMDGDFKQDPALLPGDVIYVGPVGPTIAMISPGDNGAIYEILNDSRLGSLATMVGMAGSFTDIDTVLVEKSGRQGDRKISTLDFKVQAQNYVFSDGDIFQFFPTHAYTYNSISVTGPVLRPGAYPYSDTMTVSDLLKLSRGFLVHASLDKALLIRELGIERSFNIMPGDDRGVHRKELIWLDLSKILAGDKSSDRALARLDRLKIFTKKDIQIEPMVRVIGGIRKPGKYHLTSNMTLGDLLQVAGGPTSKAYDGESSIVRRRHSADGKRHFDVRIISFNLRQVLDNQKPARILLKNSDKIVIRQVNTLEVSVKVSGWVQFPGTYILPSGSKINDLVKIAGGILHGSDLRGSVFKRKRISEIETRNLKNFYADSTERFSRIRDEVTLTGHPTESFANHLSLLGQDRLVMNMKKFQATGRVVIDLTTDNFPETDDNMVLEDGDALIIPQKMTTVMVMGRIFNPSAYLWKQGLSINDYLEKSGGYLEDADEERIYVVMANGEVKSAAQKGGKNELLSFKPNPGDIVFVPQQTLGRSSMAQIMDVLQILRTVVGIGAVGAALPNMGSATPTVELQTDNYQKQNIINEYRPEMFENNTLWNVPVEE